MQHFRLRSSGIRPHNLRVGLSSDRLFTALLKQVKPVTTIRMRYTTGLTMTRHGTYPIDDERFTVFPSRRSVVHGTKAIVSTTSPLATQAGLRILREGGNAAVSKVRQDRGATSVSHLTRTRPLPLLRS
jgi:hypothetical protein